MKDSKGKKEYRYYDAEFKKNALKLIAHGRSVSSVAESTYAARILVYGMMQGSFTGLPLSHFINEKH